jgi:UDP-glucose 4-epimerase
MANRVAPPRAGSEGRGRTVAITGPSGDLGGLLVPRLQADPSVERILTLGPRPLSGPKIDHRTVDLTRHDAEEDLADALGEHPVDVLYHLAFLHGRVRNGSLAHEVEVIGSMRVLAAAGAAQVRRLVVSSTTALYGARPNLPALVREEQPLAGVPHSRFVQDKIEVEREVRQFRERHPEIPVLVLRFAPVLGPSVDNPATRLLSRRVVPTLLGFDPLWQAIHEDDAAEALHLALVGETSGALNVVADGVLAFSGLVHEAGGHPLPLPLPVARAAMRTLNAAGASTAPPNLLDYLRYSWVADGAKAKAALQFVPRHNVLDAARSLRARN